MAKIKQQNEKCSLLRTKYSAIHSARKISHKPVVENKDFQYRQTFTTGGTIRSYRGQ